MPIHFSAWSHEQNKELHASSPHDDKNVCLVTTNYFEAHGTFKSVAITSTEVNIVSQPNLGQGIIVDSMLLNARKHNGKDITIQMTDGVNTEVIFTADLTNQDLTLTHNVPHGWKGWENARLEVVSGSTKQVSITLGYAKFPKALSYSAWDKLR